MAYLLKNVRTIENSALLVTRLVSRTQSSNVSTSIKATLIILLI